MKNIIDNTAKLTLFIWGAALLAYAVFAFGMWQFEPLRKSKFSVSEAKKDAAEQKAKREKARKNAKPAPPKKIPPREIEKIGRELARKKSRQVKKRTERVEEVTERLNEFVEKMESAYRSQRSPEAELHARIVSLTRAMDLDSRELGSKICVKLAALGGEVGKARAANPGFDCSGLFTRIQEENVRIAPFFKQIKDPLGRGRLLWQSKELARLLKSGLAKDYGAALSLGEPAKAEASDASKKDDRPDAEKPLETAAALQAFVEEKRSDLESAYSEMKSLEEALESGKAIDEVIGDAQLEKLAADEISEAMTDIAQESAGDAASLAKQAAMVVENQTLRAAAAEKAAPGSELAAGIAKNAVAAQAAADEAAQAAQSAAAAAKAAEEAFAQGKKGEAQANAKNAMQAAEAARNALQNARLATVGRAPVRPQMTPEPAPEGGDASKNMSAAIGNDLPESRAELRDFSSSFNKISNTAASLAAKANSLARQAGLPGAANPNDGAVSSRAFANASGRRAIANAVSDSGSLSGSGRMQMDLSGVMRAMAGGGAGGDDASATTDGFFSQGEILENNKVERKKFHSPVSDFEIKSQSLPGRRLYRKGKAQRRGWLFIDSWYVIGPWDATGLKTQELPAQEPERRIDLDAEYVGKRKQNASEHYKLRWRYLQTDTVNVRPYDQIGNSYYYAYSEVWAEEGMPVTLYIGSDDAAKVWINDVLVWDDYGLSPWSLSEGMVRVYLKKGYNKFLVKIHNGPNVCLFSITMAPEPDKK